MRRILVILAGIALALLPARIASAFTIYSSGADSQAAMSHSMMFGGHNDGARQLGSDPGAASGDAKSRIITQGVIAPDWYFKRRR
jgi:hypothetical protein